MAGKITTNSVVLGDSITDTQNFVLKTNADGTATLARGALGGLGTVLTVDASSNVGIGTASPQSLLDLTGNDPTLRFTDNAGSPAATWSLRSNDANFSVRSVTAGIDRLVIDSSGNVTLQKNISVGGAAPTTSGTGITFPATQSPSSDANTLDDYEEGTFTPIVNGSTAAGTGTYGNQVGQYTKIGNRVLFNLYVTWSNLVGATGNLQVGGLPFTISAVSNSYTVVSVWSDNLTLPASSYLTSYTRINSTVFDLNANIVGGGAAVNIAIDTSGGIMLAGSYSI